MAAPSKTSADRKRRRKAVTSSHVAPRGKRDRVARPVAREESPPAPKSAVRRRRSRARSEARPKAADPAMIQARGSQLDVLLNARTLSAVILVSLIVVLVLLFQSPAFYVSRIEVGGLEHLDAEEVFTLSGVANLHLFWIDPGEVRERLLESPTVADATVLVSWPPHLVQIEIREREPALIWEQAGVRTWIDVRGRVMPQRTDMEGLLRIVAEDVDDPVGPNVVIPQDVVDGALQLRALYPNIDVLLYNPVDGLGYQDGRGWRVWFGSGTNMAAKLNVYEAIVADLVARGIQPEMINLSNVDAPYYKVWWGRDDDPAASSAEE